MGLDTLFKLRISRRLPQSDVDGAREGEPARGLRYGEQAIVPIVRTEHPLAEEGSLFTTQNPTPGTALAAPVAASFADTSAFFHLFNEADVNDPAAVSLLLKTLKLAFTVAPASATGMRYLVRLDNVVRTPTAGLTLLAAKTGSAAPGAAQPGPNLRGSVARVWAFTGAAQLTLPAVSASGKVVATGGIDGLPVVGGERTIVFGGDVASTGQTSRANAVVIPPGWSCAIHIWFPSNAATGASVEPELSWAER
jgi:hypothetical protein